MPGRVQGLRTTSLPLAALLAIACGGGGGPTEPPDGGAPPLRVGQVALERLDSGEGTIELAFAAASTEFTLILQSLTPNERTFTSRIGGMPAGAAAARGLGPTGSTAGSISPEAEIRLADRRFLERFAPRLQRRPSLVPAQQLGSSRDFFVANTTRPDRRDSGDFDEVRATLRFRGDDALVYVGEEVPGLLTDAMIEDLGRAYDDGIHDTNVNAFGAEGDIDGNGRVIILLTPTVNALTTQQNVDEGARLVAFFFASDLLPDPVVNPFSNGAEIFYAAVPDPDRVFGPARFSVEEYIELMSTTFAHEHQHMINASERIQRGAPPEALWLDEGLSHFAEWLNGFFTQNRLRTALFVDNPSDTSLLFSQDALSARGAAYVFVQYLHDRFGSEVVRRLVQTDRTNVPNVEAATGEAFRDVFNDWTAALLLDGTGAADPAFQIPALDLRGNYESLKQTDFGERLPNSFLNITEAALPGASVFVNQRGTTAGYVRLTAPDGGDEIVAIDGESAANLQLGVARTR